MSKSNLISVSQHMRDNKNNIRRLLGAECTTWGSAINIVIFYIWIWGLSLSHNFLQRIYAPVSQYIFHCISTLLNYYLGLSNGPPCCHLPQCFPHNNWCPPWDMGVGGTDGQNESHPSQIYIYDCANMHWETAEELFCQISNDMLLMTFKISSRCVLVVTQRWNLSMPSLPAAV